MAVEFRAIGVDDQNIIRESGVGGERRPGTLNLQPGSQDRTRTGLDDGRVDHGVQDDRGGIAVVDLESPLLVAQFDVEWLDPRQDVEGRRRRSPEGAGDVSHIGIETKF